MTPPRWLFFPTQATGGANVTFTGDVNTDLTGVSRAGFNNWAVSGPDAVDYDEYSFSPFRKFSSFVEWIVKVDPTQTYANKGDWTSANTLITGTTLAIDTTLLFYSSLAVSGGNNGTVLRIRFYASSTVLNAFWNSGSNGDTVTMNLVY